MKKKDVMIEDGEELGWGGNRMVDGWFRRCMRGVRIGGGYRGEFVKGVYGEGRDRGI